MNSAHWHEDLGRVYFIEAVGANRIKIGYTAGEVEERRRQLQTASPFPLRALASFPGTMHDETRLHERFSTSRAVPGSEWFHATPELRCDVALAQAIEVDLAGGRFARAKILVDVLVEGVREDDAERTFRELLALLESDTEAYRIEAERMQREEPERFNRFVEDFHEQERRRAGACS
jgi:hypothetical protein